MAYFFDVGGRGAPDWVPSDAEVVNQLKYHASVTKQAEAERGTAMEREKIFDVMSGESIKFGVPDGGIRLAGAFRVDGITPALKLSEWADIDGSLRKRFPEIGEEFSRDLPRLNAAIMAARLRGFRWRKYKTASVEQHLDVILEEFLNLSDKDVGAHLFELTAALIRKFGITQDSNTTTNTMEEAPVTSKTTNSNTMSTSEMLKRNLKQAATNTALIKVNQGLAEIVVRNLKTKLPQLDTPEGRAILQTLTPVILHFVATSFPEHVPKAEAVTGYVDKASELALTQGGMMLADKAQEVLAPMAMEMFAHIQEQVAAMPAVIRDELTGPTQEEKEMKLKQEQAKMAAEFREKTL